MSLKRGLSGNLAGSLKLRGSFTDIVSRLKSWRPSSVGDFDFAKEVSDDCGSLKVLVAALCGATLLLDDSLNVCSSDHGAQSLFGGCNELDRSSFFNLVALGDRNEVQKAIERARLGFPQIVDATLLLDEVGSTPQAKLLILSTSSDRNATVMVGFRTQEMEGLTFPANSDAWRSEKQDADGLTMNAVDEDEDVFHTLQEEGEGADFNCVVATHSVHDPPHIPRRTSVISHNSFASDISKLSDVRSYRSKADSLVYSISSRTSSFRFPSRIRASSRTGTLSSTASTVQRFDFFNKPMPITVSAETQTEHCETEASSSPGGFLAAQGSQSVTRTISIGTGYCTADIPHRIESANDLSSSLITPHTVHMDSTESLKCDFVQCAEAIVQTECIASIHAEVQTEATHVPDITKALPRPPPSPRGSTKKCRSSKLSGVSSSNGGSSQCLLDPSHPKFLRKAERNVSLSSHRSSGMSMGSACLSKSPSICHFAATPESTTVFVLKEMFPHINAHGASGACCLWHGTVLVVSEALTRLGESSCRSHKGWMPFSGWQCRDCRGLNDVDTEECQICFADRTEEDSGDCGDVPEESSNADTD